MPVFPPPALSSPLAIRRQHGLTLIELMIAMTLGMGVVLAATAMLTTAKSSYIVVNDNAQVQETARYAIDVLSRAIRQANYVPHDNPTFAAFQIAGLTPGVTGLDNSRLSDNAAGLDAPQSNAANYGSDVLAIRYFGSGPHNRPDGGMVNCAGFAVAGPTDMSSMETMEAERGWSIFYIAADGAAEPELRCKYIARGGNWDSQAIARGVEAFQVLYGVSSSFDGPVTQYLNASQMTSRQWRDVVAVRFALMIRGELNAGSETPGVVYNLFGPDYRNSADAGAVIDKVRQPRRLRKLFQTTVRLRNPAS